MMVIARSLLFIRQERALLDIGVGYEAKFSWSQSARNGTTIGIAARPPLELP